MNLLYLGSHAILEYDSLRLWSDLGIDVFSIGAYTDPAHPSDDKRPPLDLPYHAGLAAAVLRQRERHAGESDAYPVIDWAKADLPDACIDWCDTVVIDCFPESWIPSNWSRLAGKRVIWRTIGQSDPRIEEYMTRFRRSGLQIVRYSPTEARIPGYAGSDAIIRFAKDPADWYGWTGEQRVVGNITQNMAARGDATGYGLWRHLTVGLDALPAGPGSERMGGLGELPYPAMQAYLRRIRVYLYTGTIPASYTLGLIEAMMTGTPVVAAPWDTGQGWLDGLYEATEFLPRNPLRMGTASYLRAILDDPELAQALSLEGRSTAIATFGVRAIAPQWSAFLGVRALVAA